MEGENKKKIAIAIVAVIALIVIILLIVKGCSVKKYKVTFDSNGGSEVSAVMVKENEKVQKPEDPTREGYIFAGWYYNDELYDFETPVKEDITLKAEWAVQGNAEVEEITLSETEISMAVGETKTLTAKVFPEDAKPTKLKWTSSDESILTVDENGKITAIKEGKATVTVETEDGKYKASCEVTVTAVEATAEPSTKPTTKPTVKPTTKPTQAPSNPTQAPSTETPATTEPTKKPEPKYTMTLTKNNLAVGGSVQYKAQVYKDGVTTEEFKSVAYNGILCKITSGMTVPEKKVGPTQATIYFNDGTSKTIPVTIINN